MNSDQENNQEEHKEDVHKVESTSKTVDEIPEMKDALDTVPDILKVKKKSFLQRTSTKVIIAVVFLVLALFFVIKSLNLGVVSDDNLAFPNENDHRLRANLVSDVSLVMYGDLTSSTSRFYYSTVQSILAEYQDNLFFVYRHFPLYPNAKLAAILTEASGRQGKFWEMTDLLFEDRLNWVDLN